MSTPSERLKWAREQADYGGPAEAAQALGMNRYTYTQHENGVRGFKTDSAVKYAKKFKVSLEWLLSGRGQPKVAEALQITQHIGAGAQIIPFPDQGTLDEVDLPGNLAGCDAAVIRGDSMPPFQPGWVLAWRQRTDGVMREDIGKLCVVDVKKGPMLVKVLREGSKKGLWTLESWDGKDRKDVVLNWASPVLFILPQ